MNSANNLPQSLLFETLTAKEDNLYRLSSFCIGNTKIHELISVDILNVVVCFNQTLFNGSFQCIFENIL